MKALDQLKKYLPSILYTLLGLLVFFLVVKVIMRLQRSSAVLGDVAVNSLENAEISKETGVAKSRINECRGIAHDVAYELETLKDMGFFEKVTHFQSDSDTIAILGLSLIHI